MVVQGYFDGNAVRTLEPVELKANQLVTINIPEPVKTKEERIKALQEIIESAKDFHAEYEEERKQSQKKAIDDLFNLLSDDEVEGFGKAMKEPLRFKEVKV